MAIDKNLKRDRDQKPENTYAKQSNDMKDASEYEVSSENPVSQDIQRSRMKAEEFQGQPVRSNKDK